MKQINLDVTRGEVILFSEGCYSDYGYCGQVVFVKDTDIKECAAIFKAWCIKEFSKNNNEYINKSGFVTWMVANGYCVPLQCREIHLGQYSELLNQGCTYDWLIEENLK